MKMWKTKYKGQGGFTLLELMIVMSIIGILSIVAIPKFNDAIAMANTSKVQTDLQTLNTAITMYTAQNGTYPNDLVRDLSDYIVDIDKLQPPKGDCFLRSGGKVAITDKTYSLDAITRTQALCQSHAFSDFGKKEKSST